MPAFRVLNGMMESKQQKPSSRTTSTIPKPPELAGLRQKRKEGGLSSRELVLAIREVDFDRKARELIAFERELRTSEIHENLFAKVQELEPELAAAKEDAAKLKMQKEFLEKRVARYEERIGQGSPDAETQAALLQERDQELQQQAAELENRQQELTQREAQLVEREAQAFDQPDLSEPEAELAGLMAQQRGRKRELDRHAEQLNQRESEWLKKLAAGGSPGSGVSIEEMEKRTKELERREALLRNLEKQLESAQNEVQTQQRDLEAAKQAAAAEGTATTTTLPDYLSDRTVLKADQVRLQEIAMAGSGASSEDLNSNVLF
ncbi:MAG: hypothetical protein N2C14_04395 [Planctomycetales bacterium]